MRAAFVAGALSVDACLGSDTPFDARIQAVRGHRGQIDAASSIATLLQGSPIRESHKDCPRVQDPYCLRCQPQVMGACLDQMRHAAQVLVTEANAVSDNPLVFADDGEISRAAISTPSPWPSRPTTSRWPSRRSARCRNGASRC